MIGIKDYNHIGIVVRDLEKCKHFYGEILGLKTIFRPPFNFPGHWYQVGPGTQLHLMVYDETIPQTMRHTALEVEDFGKALEHLKTNGVTSWKARENGTTAPISFSAKTRTGTWWRSPSIDKESVSGAGVSVKKLKQKTLPLDGGGTGWG